MGTCRYWALVLENMDPSEEQMCGTCEACFGEAQLHAFDVWCSQIMDAARKDGLSHEVMRQLYAAVRYCDNDLDGEADEIHKLAATAPTVLHVWLAHGGGQDSLCTRHDAACERVEALPERSAAYARAVARSSNSEI